MSCQAPAFGKLAQDQLFKPLAAESDFAEEMGEMTKERVWWKRYVSVDCSGWAKIGSVRNLRR